MAPNITDFSPELLCQIFKYLPLRETLSVAMLCKKMSVAVDMHLRLCKSIDFCQDAICGYMPSSITDDHLLTLLKKCPHLETVYGLHPVKIERRRLRKRSALTIPGIIEALSLCSNLKAIETSDLRLFEAIMQHLPQLEIIGHFQNRDGLFPPQASQRLKLQPYPRITSLHLIGVEVPELTAMPHLQHLHLQCVRFTKLQPFRAFLAQNLKSFVMKHCIGPSVPQRYLSLIIALSSSPNLRHLELVRVPLLNGLFQRAVEDSYRHNGFVNLRTLIIAGCKGVLEADLGHLMIVSSKNLETLHIQPSLTKDSLFVSLSFAQCSFPRLQNLHLGYIDNLNFSGEWSNDTLISFGLAEIPDTPSSITDSGMKVISQLFPHIKALSVSNCPHLMIMFQWMPSGDVRPWSKLTDLTLQKCHCLQLSSFALFISFLPSIQVVILNDMFREPPKGCSHVGLSAGTGLGMSSAVVSNQDEHIAVQGHQQDFEHPGDEENDENEREFVDVENDDNPEPHFMVLQRDFFDGDAEREEIVHIIDVEDQGRLEQADQEEAGGVENEPNNPANNEQPVNDMNNNNNKATPSSVGNSVNIPSTSSMSDNQNQCEDPSKNCLGPTNKKPSKSTYVQTDYSDLNNSQNTPNDDVKVSLIYCKNTAKPDVVDSNSVEDYDPHKPSTSKAGTHLDYSVASASEQFDMSDSGVDSNLKSDINKKRSKKPLRHIYSKKSKKSKLAEDDVSVVYSTLKNENVEDLTENNANSNKSPSSATDFSIEASEIKSEAMQHSNDSNEVPKISNSKESESEIYMLDIQKNSNGEANLSTKDSHLSKSCKKLEDGNHSKINDCSNQNSLEQGNRVSSKHNSNLVVLIKVENVDAKESEHSYNNSEKVIDENSNCSANEDLGSFKQNKFDSFDHNAKFKNRAKLKNNSIPLNEKQVSNFKAEASMSENSVKKEIVEMWDPSQPSTSRAQVDYEYPSNSPECVIVKKSHKEEKIAPCRKNKYSNSLRSNSCLGSNSSTSDESKIQTRQKVCKEESFERNSDPDIKCPISNLESVKKFEDNDKVYYVLESSNCDGSIEIINSSTGQFYKTPGCSISVSKISSRDGANISASKMVPTKTKSKQRRCISKKLGSNKSLEISEHDSSLPSTSKENNVDSTSLTPDQNTNSKKRKGKSIDNSSTSMSEKIVKRLKITNSDAALLMKKHDTKNEKCNSHSNEDESAEMKISGHHSPVNPKNNDDGLISENCDSLPSGSDQTNSVSHPSRRKRGRPPKGVKKAVKECKIKPNVLKHSGRSHCKKVHSVPMISLISQGTQATSADIRRSVRLIRRATARARRTIAALRCSRNSSHSSKISAKMLTKRPVNTKPPPEMHDKATSTSDPLLEDDAVQTLQLTSNTLLSFSVISCGISDLIIETCPVLFHVEIQACRILKRLQLTNCSHLRRLNISQCPKLSIRALAAPVMSLVTNSYILVSYEPCMQGYHPGEGEKAILSKTAFNQSVLLCHDLSSIAHDGMQAKIKEVLLEWFRFLAKLHIDLNCVFYNHRLKKKKPFENSEYPWYHDIRKKYGQYISNDFCLAGQYQILTNNPIFLDLLESSDFDTGFPSIVECDAQNDYNLISNEAMEKYMQMQKKFIGFYIPITESNQINCYK